MILTDITALAEQAAARYTLLTETWRSLFLRALSDLDFGKPSQFARISQDAYALAETYLSDERKMIEDVLLKIATEAHQTTLREIASNASAELTDTALELVSATQSYLATEMIAQVHRDVARLRQSLHQLALSVSLRAKSSDIPMRRALIEHRITHATDLTFTFNDRQARQWSSAKFVRALWRQALLSVYNQVVMLDLADHGFANAVVVHVDPKAEVSGLQISLTGEGQTYADVQNAIFHPNANAYLAKESVDVSA